MICGGFLLAEPQVASSQGRRGASAASCTCSQEPAQQRPEPSVSSLPGWVSAPGDVLRRGLPGAQTGPSEQSLEEEGEGGSAGESQGQEEGHEGASHLPLMWQHLPGTQRNRSS